MDLWDHTATSPLSPCPGWSDAWNQRALAGHTALPAWLDRGLRVSALQVTPPCLPGQLALSLDHLEPTRYRHLGPSPVTRDPIPRCCPAPAYGASHRGGDACQGPRGLLSPHRPHRQPGQPPSAPARTGLKPDGDPRGHGSRLTGRGHLGRLGRRQGWGAGALSPQPAPRPGAAEHVGGSLPLPEPPPSPSKPSGGSAQRPGSGGSAGGDTDTCRGGALAPDATPSSSPAPGPVDGGARLCSETRSGGTEQEACQPPSPNQLWPGAPASISVCLPHQGSPQGLPAWWGHSPASQVRGGLGAPWTLQRRQERLSACAGGGGCPERPGRFK